MNYINNETDKKIIQILSTNKYNSDLNNSITKYHINNWHITSLKKLCYKIKSGGTPTSTILDYYNGDIPFCTITDITNSGTYLTKTIKSITKKGLENSNAWIVPKNSLLYSMYATVGKPIINKIDVATHQGILGIIINEKIDNNYLFYFLIFLRKSLSSYLNTNTQSNINLKISENLKIAHPKTIIEQQKIASILSKVDALIESTQECIEKTQKLKKGLMQTLLIKGIGHKKLKKIKWYFNKIIIIPKEWNIFIINDICTLNAGGTPSRSKNEYWDNGDIPWLSSGEIDNNLIITTNEKISKLGLKNSAAKLFPKKTVLIAITGFGTTRGKTSLLKIEATTNQSIVGITTKKKILDEEYLWWYMQSQYYLLRNFAHGTQQPGLNLDIIKKFKIVIPTNILEQQKIASILSEVDAYIQSNQQYKEKLIKLKKGLMQKLLTGQIRVKF